ELLQLFVFFLGRGIHVGRLSAKHKQRHASSFTQLVQRLKETLHGDAAQQLQAVEEGFGAERIGAKRGVRRINIAGREAQLKQAPDAQAEPGQQHGQQEKQQTVFLHRLNTL